ncbi:hypothetical protein PVK06_003520 [Gossypium arboreum]|uniref:RNase H type-1 domain-containing protein n=1 Tax=Gossypium arboreum TaxID=29729 RepID=A0ABR0R6R5_GOSAR|nr:hypothetical protein PVK06_003520 [Gossypium arboreum]
MTEALTLKLVVEFAKKRNFEKIIMETNYQIVHNELVKKKGKDRWKLRPIIIMLDRLIKEIPHEGIQLIRRSANQAADWVASYYKKEMSIAD